MSTESNKQKKWDGPRKSIVGELFNQPHNLVATGKSSARNHRGTDACQKEASSHTHAGHSRTATLTVVYFWTFIFNFAHNYIPIDRNTAVLLPVRTVGAQGH
jgi:hypothetical protein